MKLKLASFIVSFPLLLPVVAVCSPAGNKDEKCNIDRFDAEIVAVYPHEAVNFSQGLAYESGILYESTGIYGRSTVQYYGLDVPVKKKSVALPTQYFGEGLTIVDNRIVQLTFREGTAFVYDKSTLAPVGRFKYEGEGWGLAYNGKELIMSDGSSTLRFYDPVQFRLLRKLNVKRCGMALPMLNELEYIDGELYANVWQTNMIVSIDLQSGSVVGETDLSSIAGRYHGNPAIDVLNGIAWDAEHRRLFVTGKFWPHIYQVKLIKRVSGK